MPIHAQTGNDQLEGRVVDGNKAPLEGARVSVFTPDGALLLELRSDASGGFVIPQSLPPSCQIVVHYPGFQEVRRRLGESATTLFFLLEPEPVLEHLTITATRTPQSLDTLSSPVTVLQEADLRKSPSLTLDDTLRQIPAFSLFRRTSSLVAQPTTQGVSLRGIGPSGVSRSLVLWDGTPLNDPFGGWVYWSQLDKNIVERVELVPGGSSSLYGSSALGGVIQVFSRMPESPTLELDVRGGNRGSAGGDMLAAFGLGTWNANLSASFLQTDGYFVVAPQDRGAVDDRAGSLHYAVRSSAFKRFSSSGRLSLHLSHFAEDRDNGTILQKNQTDISTLRARYRTEDARGRIWELACYGLVESFKSNFTAISQNRTRETLTLDQVVPARSAGGSAQWTQAVGAGHLLTAGVDWQWIRGDSEEWGFTLGVPSRFQVSSGSQQLGGIYLQDFWSLSKRWTIQLGARVDGWTNYHASRHQTTVSGGEQSTTPFAAQKKGTLNPRLGVSFRLADWGTLRGAYYHSFRAPTLNELYRGFRVGNIVTLANDQLGAEKLRGFEGGLDWQAGSRLSGRITGFWNGLTDSVSNITQSVTPSLITRIRQNVGETRARGFENDLKLRLLNHLEIRGSYLLSESTIIDFPFDRSLESKRFPQVPRHRMTAALAYSGSRHFDLFLSSRFVGLQFDDDQNLLPLGNFTLLDFFVSRQLNPTMQLYFAAENLLDRQFAVSRSPVEGIGAPRMLHAGFKLRF
ncbi:MAG: TonB-dependent receptor [Acidobacteriota bacterium]